MLTSTSVQANIELLHNSDALGVQSGALSAAPLAQGMLAALPLKLVHDTGDVGLVWREATPGPVLETVLQAFVDTATSMTAPVRRGSPRR